MSPDEVTASWAGLRPFYEPLLRDDRYLPNLARINPAQPELLSLLESLRTQEEAFFAHHDYAWTVEANAYNLSVEPVWQERLLGMLAAWWEVVTRPESRPLTGLIDLVVRVVFDFDVRTGAPLTPPSAGKPTFILMPLGFLEEALLLLRAESLQGLERRASLRTLLLKAMALEVAVDPQDTRQIRVLERVAPQYLRFFAKAIRYADEIEWTDKEDALSYAVIDFVMAHEAAHVLAGHTAVDLERYVETESYADRLALDIYAVSSGRRHARLERSGLARPMALFGGAPLFFSIQQAMDRLRLDLYDHLARIEPDGFWQARRGALCIASHRFEDRVRAADKEIEVRTAQFVATGNDILTVEDVRQVDELGGRIRRVGADAVAELQGLGPNTLREFRKIASLLLRMVEGPVDIPTDPQH